jgi:hypothetical protein
VNWIWPASGRYEGVGGYFIVTGTPEEYEALRKAAVTRFSRLPNELRT